MFLTNTFNTIIGKKERLVILQGGTSSGKTFAILQLLIIKGLNRAKKNIPTIISIVSETMPHLRKGAMRDFFKILNTENIYNEDFHNKSENTYTIGSTIFEFFSADMPSKVTGSRRDILFVNECNHISYDIIQQLEIRTNEKIYLDFNPEFEFWLHGEILNIRNDYFFHKSTYQNIRDILPEGIISTIEARKHNEAWWRVYGLGELGSYEGLIFKEFALIDAVPKEARMLAIGLDFGFTNDPTAIVVVYILNKQLILDELIYKTGQTNQDLYNEFINIYPQYKYQEIIADSAEPKSIEELRRMGLRVSPALKGGDSIRNSIQILHDYKFVVTKNSLSLQKELRSFMYKKDKYTGKFLNEPADRQADHAIDAIRYVALNKLHKQPSKITATVFSH